MLRCFAGRPTELCAERLSDRLGGAKIYLKREDLLHTGAHKINNALGQALLAKRMGKKRIIAETGAGQHGIATASVCARFGFECVIYMGAEDMRRQALNVFRMRLSGAEVQGVEAGSKTLKEAINEPWIGSRREKHSLHPGFGLGATLPRYGAGLSSRDRRRNEKPIPEDGRPVTRRNDCMRRRWHDWFFFDFLEEEDVQLVEWKRVVDLWTKANTAQFEGQTWNSAGMQNLDFTKPDGQINPTHSVSAGLITRQSALNTLSTRTVALTMHTRGCGSTGRLCHAVFGGSILPALETSHGLA